MSALNKWRVTTVFADHQVQSFEFLWENPGDLGVEIAHALFDQLNEAGGAKIATIIIQPAKAALNGGMRANQHEPTPRPPNT